VDNVVYRLGFAPSRRAARQFVLHGHILVNGRKANIPSLVLKEGDTVEVRDRKESRDYATRFLEVAESRGRVAWLSMDKQNLRGQILHIPSREEIAPVVREHLVVELYSK
jgi:small subunit ribosomal protein S4